MRLAEVSFPSIKVESVTEDLLAALAGAVVWGTKPHIWEYNGEKSFSNYDKFLMDLHRLPDEVPYQVHRYITTTLDGSSLLNRPTEDRAPMFNEKVKVIVPGFGLLLITDVQVLTDCCTEALQRELDQGWRILAICPQPNQRRPDYVLGRTVKDADA